MSIVDLSRQAAPSKQLVDVCVIGSGCGGATTARVLAEAGLEVVVLEEGPDKTGAELTQRGAEMYDQLYMDRGGRSTEDLSISVMQGRALGGGGVINACDVVPIPQGVLEHWQRRYGLSQMTTEHLAPFEAMALEDLAANRIIEEQLNAPNRLLMRGAEALGWRGERMMHNRVGCVGLGTCLIGCPVNAKKNPRFVSIPAAQRAGASFWVRARSTRIETGPDGIHTVHGRTLDTRGYRERSAFQIRAKTVVVAANAVSSAQLILRSGLGNEHVGRNLTLQPQLPLVARFDEDLRGWEGIPQAWALTEFEQEDHPEYGLWGFRIEPIMGTPDIVATLLPATGASNLAMMRSYHQLAGSLLLVPDAPSGQVSVNRSGRPVIHYEQQDNHKARLREAIRAGARAYLAAGAREVLVPTQPQLVIRSERDLDAVDSIPFLPATAPMISAHQQGTLRMAPSATGGALDPRGQLYGSPGIYVLDSSGFPTSSSSHTMAPIITIARALSAELASELA